MASNREKDFGLLISIVLPGFITLLGFVYQSETLRMWIGQPGTESPSIGGFLMLTVASVFAGITVSTIRWATLDSIHHLTGLRQPKWDSRSLKNREQAFGIIVDAHYRYYQFYGNSMVAIPFLLMGRWIEKGFSAIELCGGVIVLLLFFAGSRDTLRKYYRRSGLLFAA